MNRFIWAILLLLFSFGCNAYYTQSKTQLFYRGHVFYIPANASVILSKGGDENILILRYGSDKGKRYLAFYDMEGDKSLDFGCKPSVFFDAVFVNGADTDCDKELLDSFKEGFVTGNDTGSWFGKSMTIYYSIGEKQSFLFTFDKSGKALKIDTDFLTKDELKHLVSGAL